MTRYSDQDIELTAQSRTFKDAQIEDWTIRKADQRTPSPLMSTTTHHRRDSTWSRLLRFSTRQFNGSPSPWTFFHADFRIRGGKALCPFFPSRQDTVHNILRSLAVFGGAIHPSIFPLKQRGANDLQTNDAIMFMHVGGVIFITVQISLLKLRRLQRGPRHGGERPRALPFPC